MENGFVTLAQFGYRSNPFDGSLMETSDMIIMKRVVDMAIKSQTILSVVAPFGTGKTTSFETIQKSVDAHFIFVDAADKGKIGINDIEYYIIGQLLPSESIRRYKMARSKQVQRAVGQAVKKKPVLLILEEAHRLHSQTLLALKSLREYKWMGRAINIPIILIGQYDKLRAANLSELSTGIRSDTYTLKGLAPSEAVQYINETVGEHFEEEAIKAISELPVARNFLELQEALIILMNNALNNGSKKITVFDVFSIYGGGIKQIMEKYDIKPSILCETSGLDKTTVSLLINNRPHTLNSDTERNAREAINSALKNLIPQTGKHTPAPLLKAVNDGA